MVGLVSMSNGSIGLLDLGLRDGVFRPSEWMGDGSRSNRKNNERMNGNGEMACKQVQAA